MMIFNKYKSMRLPNGHYSIVLFADREIYGNCIGVNRGIMMDFTHENAITVWRWILKRHSKSIKD